MTRENQTSLPVSMSEEEAYDEAPVDTPKQPVEPDPVVTAADIPDEDQVLAYTHMKRKQIVTQLTANGVPVNDSKQMGSLLQTLDGMDRQSLVRKRMNADKEIAQGQNDASASLLAAVLKQIPNIPRPAAGTATVTREVPVLPAEFETGDLVEGQTEKAPVQDTYQSFMARSVS